MALFRRSKKESPSGPPPAEMRGRAAEITDPADLGWEVVWEALKTEPPSADGTLTRELGLGEEHEIIQNTTDMPGTEFSGTRNGRRVSLRIGVVPSIWRERGANDAKVYRVHKKLGEPCHVCGAPIAQVDFEEHTIYYCPECQTGGRVLKDRRMSRLLR